MVNLFQVYLYYLYSCIFVYLFQVYFKNTIPSNKIPNLQNLTDFSVPPPPQHSKSTKLAQNILLTSPWHTICCCVYIIITFELGCFDFGNDCPKLNHLVKFFHNSIGLPAIILSSTYLVTQKYKEMVLALAHLNSLLSKQIKHEAIKLSF